MKLKFAVVGPALVFDEDGTYSQYETVLKEFEFTADEFLPMSYGFREVINGEVTGRIFNTAVMIWWEITE